MKLSFEKMMRNTPEFLEFVEKFKEQIDINLTKNGAKLIDFHIGFYYFSGYFEFEDKLFYFGWHNTEENLLYRRAHSKYDFSGEPNQYIKIEKGVIDKLCQNIKNNP